MRNFFDLQNLDLVSSLFQRYFDDWQTSDISRDDFWSGPVVLAHHKKRAPFAILTQVVTSDSGSMNR